MKILPNLRFHVFLLLASAVCLAYWLALRLLSGQSSWIVVDLPVDVGYFREAMSAEMLQPVANQRLLEDSVESHQQRSLEMQNPLIAERIQQLSERTRICSRRVWEESYLPELRGEEGAERMKPAMAQCCVCVSPIGMSDQVRGLACGHIFHLACIAECFMRDRTFNLCCPLCRVPLSDQPRFSDWDEAAATKAREATE